MKIGWMQLFGVAALLALLAVDARADRTRSTRTAGQQTFGAKKDITVKFLNNGSSFNGYSVAPKIYSSPTVDDPNNPQQKPVYNLPFYGAKQSFGGKSNGATPK